MNSSKNAGRVLLAGIVAVFLSSHSDPAAAAPAAGNVVILIVNDLLLPEVSTEVARLQSDLAAEGNLGAKIRSWSTADGGSQELWTYLKAEYAAVGSALKGAILIGHVPCATNSSTNEFTDLVYWNMTGSYGTTSPSSYRIWVSRIYNDSIRWNGSMWVADSFFGSEVALIRRALQTNHDCRTGASRLPSGAFWYTNGQLPVYGTMNNLLKAWPTVQNLTPRQSFLAGGDCLTEQSHGNGGTEYDSEDIGLVHDTLCQVRSVVQDSCDTGMLYSGLCGNLIATRGGGCVLSIGASSVTYMDWVCLSDGTTPENNFLNKLAAGSTWGDGLVASYPFTDTVRMIFYGDLSIKAKAAPANQMPAVNSFTPSAISGVAPLTVNFTGSASDPDGAISLYEWFPQGHCFGKVDPTAAGPGLTSTTHTYTLPHRYLARLEVVDDYKARAWQEVIVDVAPRGDQALRVNCGNQRALGYYSEDLCDDFYQPDQDFIDSAGRLWLHDQAYQMWNTSIYDNPLYAAYKPGGTWGWRFAGGGGYPINFTVPASQAVQGTNNPTLYQSMRVDYNRGGITYVVPLPNGGYTLNLGFADMVNTAAGQRLMDIRVQDAAWLTAFDIIAAAGPRTATTVSTHVNVTAGSLSFTFQTNPNSPAGNNEYVCAILNCFEVIPDSIAPSNPPVITSALTASGAAGAPFGYTITASDGPTSFNASGLPAGLVVDASTGVISGAPSVAGVSNVTLSATNSVGTGTADLVMTISVADRPPVVTSAATASPNPVTAGASTVLSVVAADPDGDPLSYSWNFGDSGTGSGATVQHSYATAGTYSATVTVADGRGASVQSSVTVSVGPAAPQFLHVSAITMSLNAGKGNSGKSASATVSIVDGNGRPVSGATVTGTWSGVTSGGGSGTTGGSGTVRMTSSKSRQAGVFTFTVTQVAAPGFTYDPGANAATSVSISSP